VLGALRAGMKTIVLPKENEADLDDVPAEAKQKLVFHTVETLEDVLKLALVDETTQSKLQVV
jgi:ATP-dependent Lon protease